MALEWTEKTDLVYGRFWESGEWMIHVAPSGFVVVAGYGSRGLSLEAAKAWCEAEDAKRLPPVPMPKVGEVWGVCLDVNTWSKIIDIARDGVIFWRTFEGEENFSVSVSAWQDWVRETGAVRIDGPREDEKCEECERLEAILDFAEKYRPQFAALANMRGDPHWGDILVVLSARIDGPREAGKCERCERTGKERNKMRESTDPETWRSVIEGKIEAIERMLAGSPCDGEVLDPGDIMQAKGGA